MARRTMRDARQNARDAHEEALAELEHARKALGMALRQANRARDIIEKAGAPSIADGWDEVTKELGGLLKDMPRFRRYT